MTDPLLDPIEAALAKATPGPWRVCPRPNNWLVLEGEEPAGIAETFTVRSRYAEDAHLIAHAPEWLSALLTRCREAEGKVETLEQRWAALAAVVDIPPRAIESEFDRGSDAACRIVRDKMRELKGGKP